MLFKPSLGISCHPNVEKSAPIGSRGDPRNRTIRITELYRQPRPQSEWVRGESGPSQSSTANAGPCREECARDQSGFSSKASKSAGSWGRAVAMRPRLARVKQNSEAIRSMISACRLAMETRATGSGSRWATVYRSRTSAGRRVSARPPTFFGGTGNLGSATAWALPRRSGHDCQPHARELRGDRVTSRQVCSCRGWHPDTYSASACSKRSESRKSARINSSVILPRSST